MDGRQNGIETIARRQQPERLSGIEECRQGQSEQLITTVGRDDVCRSEAVQASDARAERTGKRVRIALQHGEWKGTQGVRNGGARRIGIFVRVQLHGRLVRLLARRVALHGLEMGAFVSHAEMPVVRDERAIWARLKFCHASTAIDNMAVARHNTILPSPQVGLRPSDAVFSHAAANSSTSTSSDLILYP